MCALPHTLLRLPLPLLLLHLPPMPLPLRLPLMSLPLRMRAPCLAGPLVRVCSLAPASILLVTPYL
jgi:hypothetical protein